jgi:hypothetical protein
VPDNSGTVIEESIALNSGDKKLEITLKNPGSDTYRITEVTVTDWPVGNGSIKELNIDIDSGSDYKKVYSTEQSSPPFTVGSSGGWEASSESYRDIKGGTTSIFILAFDSNAGSGNYTIEITFDDGGTKTIDGPY